MVLDESKENDFFIKILKAVMGAPKQLKDPHLFHKMSLIPVLAWIGLGADGLSSSSYGPEEAFLALGSHTYLAILLGMARLEPDMKQTSTGQGHPKISLCEPSRASLSESESDFR